ncbi:MAG: HAD family hydrolase [Candidatus Rokubacteria bacterium]|nr:HAD family hydrolase [Candidatus Rokubacteria bacterium]
MACRAILFDLFDTLVRFQRDRLPAVRVNGEVVHSTVGHVHDVLRRWQPDVTLDRLYAALIESWQEAERRRQVDHREVAAPERFAHLFRCLALDPDACPRDVFHGMLEAHRRELSKVAEFPLHHGPLLRRLAERHRLGVVSNFDYTPTALGILETAGVAPLFTAILVSDAFGWRKPAPAIFEEALRRVGARAEEALFVGDRADIDVAGAQAVGIPAVWLNPEREALPAGIAPPTHEIRDLAEIEAIATATNV